MNRRETLEIIAANKETLRVHRIKALYLFGSTARDEARPDSDVDLLVEFEPDAHVGLFALSRLKSLLTGLLGHEVDLVTADALHSHFREAVVSEVIRAA